MNAWKKSGFPGKEQACESFQNFLPNPYAFLMIGIAWVVETDAIRSTPFWLKIKRAKANRIMLFCKLTYILHLSKIYLCKEANCEA